MKANDLSVLIIESDRKFGFNFAQDLIKRGFDVRIATSGSAGVEAARAELPEIVVINAYSLRTNGLRITQWLRSAWPDLPIILIIGEDETITKAEQANELLRLPFTSQKLINRMRLFGKAKRRHLFKKGPLLLNTHTNVVQIEDRQAHLTGRCSALLRAMMEKPNKVLSREDLFKQVWETNYTVDTRTLDVHISWLRGAIEENPRQPKLIETVRGVGYKLNI